MKKLFLVLISAVMLAGCGNTTAQASEGTAHADSFNAFASASASAESITFNSSYTPQILDEHPDMSVYVWLQHSEPFKQISFDEGTRFIEQGGTGILFYGAGWCPYCQRAIVELGQAAYEEGVDIYYVSLTNRDVSLEQIMALCQHLDWVKWEKDETTGENEPQFQIPEVIAVRNGEIVGHMKALPDDVTLTDENSQMSDDQKKELQDIYKDLFRKAAE